jgi:hypothetical protein
VLAFVLFVALSFVACGTKRPSIVYRLDSGVRGWVVIVFNRPEAAPLPMHGGAFVIDVPSSGVVATSTKPPIGSASDVFVVREADGRERPLPAGSIQSHHLGRSKRGGDDWIDFETFFFGSRAGMDAAESEDQALARARALLPPR